MTEQDSVVKRLSFLDRFLTLWIFLAMFAGVLFILLFAMVTACLLWWRAVPPPR